jgi:hypothetical protein
MHPIYIYTHTHTYSDTYITYVPACAHTNTQKLYDCGHIISYATDTPMYLTYTVKEKIKKNINITNKENRSSAHDVHYLPYIHYTHYVHTHICTHTHVYACVHVCLHIYIYMYT